MTKALIIDAKPQRVRVEEFNDSLQQLNEWVGGYICGISGPGWHAYVNDDGLINGLPNNELATALANAHGYRASYWLAGNAVFFGPVEGDGDDSDVPEELVTWTMLAVSVLPHLGGEPA